MKHYPFLAVFALLFILSCRKEPGISGDKTKDHYLENVQQALRNSLKGDTYRELDFIKAVLTSNDSLRLYVLRIPFNKDPGQYVVVKTSQSGIIESGKIVRLTAEPVAERSKDHKSFNGEIAISDLNQSSVFQSKVTNGFIEVIHRPGVRGLFMKLQEMKQSNHPGAQDISIPVIGVVGASSGPCQ